MARPRHDLGFTFLEILIVVLLIGVFASAFLPRLGGSFSYRIREARREIVAELNYTAQRAVARGRFQRWEVNLDEQRFRIQEGSVSETIASSDLPTHAELLDLSPPKASFAYAPVENRTGEWRWLESEEVVIDEIRIGDERYTTETAGITFAPDGGADPAQIWLVDEGGREIRIRITAFTGEIHVDEDIERD